MMLRNRYSNKRFGGCAIRSALRRIGVLGAVFCVTISAGAQQFRVDPVDDKARIANRHKAIQSLKNSADYAANKQNFDEFFLKYYFPAMTRTSPDQLAELGKLRYELFKQYLWATSNAELQKDLTQMAYDAMLKVAANLEQLRPKPVVADPPYHPAVRYNAILIIGLLDEQYAVDAGTGGRPPKPLPAANKIMTAMVERATTGSQFPPPVILGAIIGLERHAKYRDALEPGAADKMTAALLKLVSHDKPIQDMDRETYAWLRIKAASALAQLGSVGQNNAVHNAIIQLVGTSKSIDDRCSAAALLNRLKYEGVKVDAPATTMQLFTLARDLGQEEAKRAQEFEDMRIAGGGGFVSPLSERISITDPDSEQDAFPRRQVLARLVDLRRGLTAVKPAVPEDAQKQIDAVLAAIQPAIKAASDQDTVALRVAQEIRAMADAINQAAPPAEEPPAERTVEAPTAEAPAAEAPAAEAPTVETPPPAAPATEPPAEPPAAEPPAAEN